MENGILIEILNSLHKLLGLPVIQGTIDPQHVDCIKKCGEVTHFYKTECLAKCGINPVHINTILDVYTTSTTSNSNDQIPNSTNHEINLINLNNSNNNNNNNNQQLPRVTELFHNLTKIGIEKQQQQHAITKNLTELHREIIRRLFDDSNNNNNFSRDEFGGPTLETIDVKYFYLFAFMALTPVLVLFYCCYKQFTKPLTTAYSDSNNHSTRHNHHHQQRRRRVYLGQLPPRENSELSIQNSNNINSSILPPSNVGINESRIRTVSLPAYEDCVKSSLSDLEDNTYSGTKKLDSKKKTYSENSYSDSKEEVLGSKKVRQLESGGEVDSDKAKFGSNDGKFGSNDGKFGSNGGNLGSNGNLDSNAVMRHT